MFIQRTFTENLLCANPVPAPGSTAIVPALKGLVIHWRRSCVWKINLSLVMRVEGRCMFKTCRGRRKAMAQRKMNWGQAEESACLQEAL